LPQETPEHVAIIMAGANNWARLRKLPEAVGHRQGAETLEQIVYASQDLGIGYLTVVAVSSENALASEKGASLPLGLFRRYLLNNVDSLNENNIKLRVIGERSSLPVDLNQLISKAEVMTEGNSGLSLTLMVNFGGRQEILSGVRQFCEQVKNGTINPANLDEEDFEEYLDTYDLPDPDLVIWTGGIVQLLNSLLWEVAYSEFLFLDTPWPDFTALDLKAAVKEFGRRERRFGHASGH